jgi:diguanylate cyclase (GGDEF)-like protein
MLAPETPAHESSRVAALWQLGLLDTEPKERFDRITRLAQALFGVPIALVSLVDSDRQWFKSSQGLAATETPREISFCGHAINETKIFYVADAELDPRFSDNPLVTGGPRIRFYAGCPIAAPDGSLVGTVCVIDHAPRFFGQQDFAALSDLAAIVEQELVLGQLAIDDELTGLHNRRGFELLARQSLAVCQRQETNALVVFADVDDLKRANDTDGHAAGDRLLRDFGQVLRESLREADVIARIGGDEFAAFLSGYSAVPQLIVDRIMAAVDAHNAGLGSADLPLSVSVGSAAMGGSREMLDLDLLLQQADQAMYHVKRERRASLAPHRAEQSVRTLT